MSPVCLVCRPICVIIMRPAPFGGQQIFRKGQQQIFRNHQLHDSSKPISALDVDKPGWRDLVPLHLDDDVARHLLEGLLLAPEPPGLPEAPGLSIGTFLHTEGSLRMERRLQGPPEIDATTLATQLQVRTDDLPPRVNIHLLTEDGERVTCGVLSALYDGQRFEVQLLQAPIDRARAVEGRILLAATFGPREVACVPLPGGEPLDDVPWIFEGSSQCPTHSLVAAGSYWTRADGVVVAAPSGHAIREDPGSHLEEWGEVTGLARRVALATGRIHFAHGEEVFTVTTRHPDGEAPRITLTGQLRRFGPSDCYAWLGAPNVIEHGEGGVVRRVKTTEVEWRPRTAGAPWRSLDETSLGRGQIRVFRDGAPIFRSSCTILPGDFGLRLRPVDGARGEVRVESRFILNVGLTGPAAEAVEKQTEGTTSILALGMQTPLPSVEVWIRFAGGGEATLAVPYPARLVAFHGRGGVPLRHGDRISLDGLSSTRARAITPNPSDRFVLEARSNQRAWIPIHPLYKLEAGCSELPLDVVRDALRAALVSVSKEIEGAIELRIVPDSGVISSPPPTLTLGWYDARLEKQPSPGGGDLVHLGEPFMRTLGEDVAATLRVLARPMHHPEAPAIQLPREGGAWIFAHANREPGPWLVVGMHSYVVRVRPLLITVRGAPAEATSALERAVRISHPRARRQALEEVAAALASDFGHPDWPRAQSFLATLGMLPATTFDVVRAIADNPEAAVMALLKTPGKDFERTWAGLEELSCLFSIVPIRAWISAARRLVAWVDANPSPWHTLGWTNAQAVRELLQVTYKRGPERARFMSVILEVLHRCVPDAPVPPDAPMLSHARALRTLLLSQEKPTLLGRHTHDTWPTWDVRAAVTALAIPPVLLDTAYVRPDARHHDGVYNAPVLAAAISVLDRRPDDDTLFHLRRVRAFDEPWFDVAHATALMCLLTHELERDPGCFDEC